MTAHPQSPLPRRAADIAAPAVLAAVLAAGLPLTLARCGAAAPAPILLPQRPAPLAFPAPVAPGAAVDSRWKLR